MYCPGTSAISTTETLSTKISEFRVPFTVTSISIFSETVEVYSNSIFLHSVVEKVTSDFFIISSLKAPGL
ncbi:hypothetical protein D3C85_1489570 [compost metagenome]